MVKDTIFSILTIINSGKLNHDYKFVIVTNQSEKFLKELKKINFQYMSDIILEQIDDAIVVDWIGIDKYIFRVKIKAIEYFLNNYKQNLLFFDSDIFAKKNISPLFDYIEKHNCVMYCESKNMEKHMQNAFKTLNLDKAKIKKMHVLNNELTFEGFEYSIPCHYSYYSSPVVGLHYDLKDLLPLVLEFSDKLYHVTTFGVTEEISFSYIFQKFCGEMIQCADSLVITHDLIFNVWELYFPYILGMQTTKEKICFERIMQKYNMDLSILNNLQLTYDNFLMYLIIMKNYIYHQELNYDKLLKEAVKEGFISDDCEMREKLFIFLNRVKKTLLLDIQKPY